MMGGNIKVKSELGKGSEITIGLRFKTTSATKNRGVIQEFEENNSGVDLFHFDSDEDVFCVYSQYIDDLMLLSKMIRATCDNEKTMGMYLNMSEVAKA